MHPKSSSNFWDAYQYPADGFCSDFYYSFYEIFYIDNDKYLCYNFENIMRKICREAIPIEIGGTIKNEKNYLCGAWIR